MLPHEHIFTDWNHVGTYDSPYGEVKEYERYCKIPGCDETEVATDEIEEASG